MRVLVLGGSGMLGHKVYQKCREGFDTQVTMRGDRSKKGSVFDPSHILKIDHSDIEDPRSLVEKANPGVVINCIGITNPRNVIETYLVNAVFPHKLASACDLQGSKLIHISTDCVFSGRHGGYTELSVPDPTSLYGWSKLLGEIALPQCLTLRTSFIGREIVLRSKLSLLEWLFSKKGTRITGYTHAIFSGVTADRLSQLIVDIVETKCLTGGLFHVGGKPISKYNLLKRLIREFDLGITVIPDSEVKCDRSFSSSKFYRVTGFAISDWPQMIKELRINSHEDYHG